MIKNKNKIKLMRSGGISDEDALNRPFPFTLVVNNPTTVIFRLFKMVEAYDCCHGLKIKIRLAVLTADYLTSDNEPNPSARRGKQTCLTLICSYHAIGNAVVESCGERISIKTSVIDSYR